MFSLFYGLPPTYWDAFAGLARPPVVMDLFQQRGYQFGVFVAAPAHGAVGLERTAFARVPNLRLQTQAAGRTQHEKDYVLTQEWYDWKLASVPFSGRSRSRPIGSKKPSKCFVATPNMRFPISY